MLIANEILILVEGEELALHPVSPMNKKYRSKVKGELLIKKYKKKAIC